MKSNRLLMQLALLSTIISSCENRNTVCECLDLGQRFNDQMTKSQNDIEEFEKGCEWISKELSPIEMVEEMEKCTK